MATLKTTPPPAKSRGGARANTRGGLTDVELSDYEVFQKARAQNELIKAKLGEIELGKQRGELLRKNDVEVAASRLHAFLAQSLRSLPDDLERKCGLDPTQVQFVQDYIDSLTTDIRARLSSF